MATVVKYPARSRRGAELALLTCAIAIGVAGYQLTAIGTNTHLSAHFGWHVLTLIILAGVTHILIRRFAPYADPIMLPLAVAINGIGLAMIYRLDIYYEAAQMDGYVVGIKQLLMTVIGVVLAWLTLILIRDHRSLRKLSYTAMVLAIILLLSPMIPGLGKESYGAKIWIQIGPASFQPAELAKILLAIFFAGYLEYRRDSLALAGRKIWRIRLPRGRDLGPILVVWVAASIVLVLQKDLGTSLLLFGLFVAMLYVATDRPSWIAIGFGLFIPTAILAIRMFPHVGARFDIWLHALDNDVFNRDPGGSGQLVRGLFGMASGGLMGTGWGQGYPGLVPFANSDFIVPSLAEELGLTGLLAILAMYLLLVSRGMRAALGARDGFGKLLAAGLSFTIALQVFIVVGGVTRLIPLTGLTTPFLAYGGSSLVSNWIILAILLRISDAARRPLEAEAKPSPGKVNPVNYKNGLSSDEGPDDSMPTEQVVLP